MNTTAYCIHSSLHMDITRYIYIPFLGYILVYCIPYTTHYAYDHSAF